MHNPDAALAFVTVVREGSFTAAARALHLPKATLSRRIRELESALGARLLNRTTRRQSLTEAGEVYFRHCAPIATALEDGEAAVAQLRDHPRGWLRVTAPYSLVENLLAPMLADFLAQYPEVRIDLSLSHQVLDIVDQGIDVALRMGPLADSSLTARRLAVLPNRLYATSAYLSRHGEPGHPSQLLDHRTLVTRIAARGDGFAWPMRRPAQPLQDYPVAPVVVADDPDLLKAPLLAGQGIMMATDLIMAQLLAAGLVRPILPEWTGRCPELHAVFPGGPVQPPKLRLFIDFLVSRLEREAAPTQEPATNR
jgi:DNA-binding transcriptional LysR family regulator